MKQELIYKKQILLKLQVIFDELQQIYLIVITVIISRLKNILLNGSEPRQKTQKCFYNAKCYIISSECRKSFADTFKIELNTITIRKAHQITDPSLFVITFPSLFYSHHCQSTRRKIHNGETQRVQRFRVLLEKKKKREKSSIEFHSEVWW